MDNSLYGQIKQSKTKLTKIEKENTELKNENLNLQLALAGSEEARLQSELDIQLAIAELAEGGI